MICQKKKKKMMKKSDKRNKASIGMMNKFLNYYLLDMFHVRDSNYQARESWKQTKAHHNARVVWPNLKYLKTPGSKHRGGADSEEPTKNPRQSTKLEEQDKNILDE